MYQIKTRGWQLIVLLVLAISPQLLTAQNLFSKAKSVILSTTSQRSSNGLYLFGGMDLSKQVIGTGSYTSAFNYNLSNYDNDAFKPGFFAGLSLQSDYVNNHALAFDLSMHRMSTGTHYKESVSMQPFLGSFSHFKADNIFWMMNTAVHYKQILNITDTSKFKIKFVVGPSLDTRLSAQSEDNIAHNNYHRFVLKGDIGLEFNNRNYYTFFIHYKQGISSFNASPIHTSLNSFDFGMLVRASDFF